VTPLSRLRGALRHAADPLLRNSFLLAVNVVAGSAAGFLYWTFAARNYAPGAVGAAGAITSLLPLVTTCASLGLTELIIRHYAGESDRLALLRRSTLTAVSAAALLATLWWGLADGRRPLAEVADGAHSYGLLLAAVVATTAGMFTTATWIASRRPAYALAETVAGSVTRIAALLALREHGAAGILLSFALGAAASALTGGLLIAVVLRPRGAAAKKRLAAGQRNFALVNWASALVSLSPRAAAVTLIVWRAGTEAAAWVTIPLMTLPMLTIVPSVLGRSLFAEASHEPSRLPRILRKAILVALVATSVGMVLVLLLAPTFLGIFGDGYVTESSTLLRLLAVASVVAAPNYMLDVALNVSGHRSGFLVTNVVGTGAFLVLLVLLSPFGPAGIGAAWIAGQGCYLLTAFTAWRTCERRAAGRLRAGTAAIAPLTQTPA